MNYLEIAQEQIRRDEGVQKKAYRDTVGKITIGIGRNLDDVGLNDEEIDFLFENDLDRAVNEARQMVTVFDTLSETRKAVLVNMAFNMGGKLSGFQKFLAAVGEGRYVDAGREMLDSVWAQQVGARALRLSQQMASGDHP